MAKLLVSVRSPVEVEAALSGGAALIDVKEPKRGPLGRADEAVITSVVTAVAGQRPVSAALGELLAYRPAHPIAGLSYAKWGLAGCGKLPHWRRELMRAQRSLLPGCQAVAVAYADWQLAGSPPPEEVCAFACAEQLPFLVDTWSKDTRSLLDWLTFAETARLCARCRRAGVSVALAGSLDATRMKALQPASPDWFAIRGAGCRQGRRELLLDRERVRQLAAVAADSVMASTSAD